MRRVDCEDGSFRVFGTDWELFLAKQVMEKHQGVFVPAKDRPQGYFYFVDGKTTLPLDQINQEIQQENNRFILSTSTKNMNHVVYDLDEKTIQDLTLKNPKFRRFGGLKYCKCWIRNGLQVCNFCRYACCDQAKLEFMHKNYTQCNTHGKKVLEKKYF